MSAARLGSGKRFAAMVNHLKHEKYPPQDAEAIAAAAGRAKYGKAKMQAMAHAHEALPHVATLAEDGEILGEAFDDRTHVLKKNGADVTAFDSEAGAHEHAALMKHHQPTHDWTVHKLTHAVKRSDGSHMGAFSSEAEANNHAKLSSFMAAKSKNVKHRYHVQPHVPATTDAAVKAQRLASKRESVDEAASVGDHVEIHGPLNGRTGTGPGVKLGGVVTHHSGTGYVGVHVTHVNGTPTHEYLDKDKVYGKLSHEERKGITHQHVHQSHFDKGGSAQVTYHESVNETSVDEGVHDAEKAMHAYVQKMPDGGKAEVTRGALLAVMPRTTHLKHVLKAAHNLHKKGLIHYDGTHVSKAKPVESVAEAVVSYHAGLHDAATAAGMHKDTFNGQYAAERGKNHVRVAHHDGHFTVSHIHADKTPKASLGKRTQHTTPHAAVQHAMSLLKESVSEDMMSGDIDTGRSDDTHMVVAGAPGMAAKELKLKPNDVQSYGAWKPMTAAKDTKYKKPIYSGKLKSGDGDHHVFDLGGGEYHAFAAKHVKASRGESVDEAHTLVRHKGDAEAHSHVYREFTNGAQRWHEAMHHKTKGWLVQKGGRVGGSRPATAAEVKHYEAIPMKESVNESPRPTINEWHSVMANADSSGDIFAGKGHKPTTWGSVRSMARKHAKDLGGHADAEHDRLFHFKDHAKAQAFHDFVRMHVGAASKAPMKLTRKPPTKPIEEDNDIASLCVNEELVPTARLAQLMGPNGGKVPNQVDATASKSMGAVPVDVAPVDMGVRHQPTCEPTVAALSAAIARAGIPLGDGGCVVEPSPLGGVAWRWTAPGNRVEGEVRVVACLGGLGYRTTESKPGSGSWLVSLVPFADHAGGGPPGMVAIQPDEVEDRSNQHESVSPAQRRTLVMLRRLRG